MLRVGVGESRLQKKIREGKVAYGLGIFSGSMEFIEIAGYTGFDWVYPDTHISPTSLETVQALIAAAYMVGVSPIVRVTQNEPNMINRALNMGAEGVIVPHIKNRKTAEEVMHSALYEPAGERGCCPNIRATRYGSTPWDDYEYQKMANEANYIIPVVEGREGVDNFEDIITVPGVKVIGIGMHDLSVSLGVPGKDCIHPIMRNAVEQMLAACKKHNVVAWATTVLSMSPSYTEMLEEMGFGMINFNTDLGVFYLACKRLMAKKGL